MIKPMRFNAIISFLENGYKYLKFHLEGATLDTFTREELERLRTHVAQNLLFIPPEFVFVQGIEPSNSLIITFMVPQGCLSSIDMKDSISLASFSSLSVDAIYVDEKKVPIKGNVNFATTINCTGI